jgi:AcrR family transcriptional regulator
VTATNESPTADWRTTRKARTFLRIQEEAMRLFLEQGYEATTVEEIAAAAGVSHMTVFRHFPTKEALVLTDYEDPLLAAAIRRRPPTEPSLDAMEHAFLEVVGTLPASGIDLRRSQLIFATPALRAALWGYLLDMQDLVAEALAARGDPPGDPADFRVAAAIGGAVAAVSNLTWIEEANRRPLSAVIKETFAAARRELGGGS